MQTAKKKHLVEGFFNIDWIIPNPLNPRRKFDQTKLEELAASIREVGILQPLVVTPDETSTSDNFRYRLIAGERRWRAAKLAGLEKVPATVVRVSPDQERRLMLIENLQREDLDPIDEARAFETLTREHGWKQQDLARELGVSQAHIANRIRLLKLPEELQENISAGIIPHSVGKELVSYCKVPGVAEELLEDIKKLKDGETIDADIINHAKREAWEKTKPLHKKAAYPEPQFGLKLCEKCSEKITLINPYYNSDGNRYPRCLNTKCWDKKQDAARAEKNEAVRKKLVEEIGKDKLINISDLEYGTYRFLEYGVKFDLAGCETCKNLKEGYYDWQVESDKKTTKICIDPNCFEEKTNAAEKEILQREKEAQKKFEAWKNKLLNKDTATLNFDGLDKIDQDVLLYITAQAVENPPGYMMDRRRFFKEFLKHYKWPKEIQDLSYSERVKKLVVELLRPLEPQELYKILRFAMFKAVGRNDEVLKAVFGEFEVDE